MIWRSPTAFQKPSPQFRYLVACNDSKSQLCVFYVLNTRVYLPCTYLTNHFSSQSKMSAWFLLNLHQGTENQESYNKTLQQFLFQTFSTFIATFSWLLLLLYSSFNFCNFAFYAVLVLGLCWFIFVSIIAGSLVSDFNVGLVFFEQNKTPYKSKFFISIVRQIWIKDVKL